MSTEHQQYSPQNQADAIETYAARHRIQIVRKYADHGRSGLNLAGRAGLRALLDDVANGRNDFSELLVYDISRWGRFQDADESAHYEYLLKKAGINVHYCAEQFSNDGSMQSALFKAIKRAMAGEYSRELSVKVFAGQSRLIKLGFRQGGLAGYGLRRQLLDIHGNPKGRLSTREYKSLQSDRVILVPGPESEIAVITSIFQSFIEFGKGETEIAADLNRQGQRTHYGKPWAAFNVHEVLVNPKYTGMNVYNRSSFKLKQKHIRNPASQWIRCAGAFEALVSTEDFEAAQAILSARGRCWTDNEMVDGLRELLKTLGQLSNRLIDKDGSIPRSQTYARRFGGLKRAYALVGWRPVRDFSFMEANKIVRKQRRILISTIVDYIKKIGATIDTCSRKELFLINQEFTASIHVARCYRRPNGHQWRIKFDRSKCSDVSIVARLNAGDESVLDYYVFPSTEIYVSRLRLRQSNTLAVDAYRFDSLDAFLDLCGRRSVKGTA